MTPDKKINTRVTLFSLCTKVAIWILVTLSAVALGGG